MKNKDEIVIQEEYKKGFTLVMSEKPSYKEIGEAIDTVIKCGRPGVKILITSIGTTGTGDCDNWQAKVDIEANLISDEAFRENLKKEFE